MYKRQLDGHYYHFLRARAESENTKYRADMYDKREEEHQWMKELFEYWGIDTPEAVSYTHLAPTLPSAANLNWLNTVVLLLDSFFSFTI